MNEKECPILVCQVTIEYQGAQNAGILRKTSFRNAQLRLVRNEFREMFLEIRDEKGHRQIRHKLENVNILKRFINEGKVSIIFKNEQCIVMVSNAPPSELFEFVHMLVVKMVSNNEKTTSFRDKMLSSKPQSINDISPLTDKDLEKAKKKVNVNKTPDENLKKTTKRSADDTVMNSKAKKNCLQTITEQVLCDEQKEVLNAARLGLSIFFTGSAGTGKSHLLRSIIAALPPEGTYATASTGVAACHIGGTTLHQFAGIGTGEGGFEQCLRLASRPMNRQVWRKCQRLIIDEISMVHADFFDKLEHVARVLRKNDKPFGGIQLILCGDFFQLPPVGPNAKFCFQSQSWNKCIQRSFELVKIHRQSDPELINLLQSIRIGRVTPEITDRLLATKSQIIEKEGILATRLCTHTDEAASINKSHIQNLSGETRTYQAEDAPASACDLLDKLTPVAKAITLKVGAQVMLMKNINLSQSLVNGSRGVIEKFDKDGLPIVRFSDCVQKIQKVKMTVKNAGGVVLSRMQVPLSLAWAFSIHKSQGLTLDCVEMSLARVFAPGQAYVALSRIKNLQSLRVVDFSSSAVWANKDVLVYYQKFRRQMQALRAVPIGKPTASSCPRKKPIVI